MKKNSEPYAAGPRNVWRTVLEVCIFLSVGLLAYWVITLIGTFEDKKFTQLLLLNYISTGFLLQLYHGYREKGIKLVLIANLILIGSYIVRIGQLGPGETFKESVFWYIFAELPGVSLVSFLTWYGITTIRDRALRARYSVSV